MDSFQDTIIALSTPPGQGALGIIRISGPAAIPKTDKLFFGAKLSEQASHTLHYGHIKDANEVIDEVVVSLFRAPKSFTTEDVVEISCHGSSFIQQRIIELFLENGLRQAKPGEFSQRAFLNGRIDLSQAEAIADLIASDSAQSHKLAMQQMRGGVKDEIAEIRQELLDLVSLLELELDFSEEDLEFADRERIANLLQSAKKSLLSLQESFSSGNAIKNGIPTVIIGKPNAGKSTLLNVLLKEDRAIVSEVSGTTRDSLEELLFIGGFAFRLIDTAGVRETEDAIEKIGVERTFRKLEEATLVIMLLDASKEESAWETLRLEKDQELLVVWNKTDLQKREEGLCISALNGDGIDSLKGAMLAFARDKLQKQNVMLTQMRHHEAVSRGLAAIADTELAIEEKRSSEFVSADLKRGIEALGEITGEVTTDEILGNIFSKFCIGK